MKQLFFFFPSSNSFDNIQEKEIQIEKPKLEKSKGSSNEQIIENKNDHIPKSKVDTDVLTEHTTPTPVLLTQQNNKDGTDKSNVKRNFETVEKKVDEKLTYEEAKVKNIDPVKTGSEKTQTDTTIKDIENPGKIPEGDKKPGKELKTDNTGSCLLYTSPSPRDATLSRMPSSA